VASVATEGDVTATTGEVMYTGATTGTWTAGVISYTSYGKLQSGSARTISNAQCTFTFSGDVLGSETLTLRAGSTKLQLGLSGVIVDGDSVIGTFGNRLVASSARALKTE
jgi:hypothetical protein